MAHDTDGIHDTITHMDVNRNTGNGFLFKDYEANGLSRAIDEAIEFYNLPLKIKKIHWLET
jgi:starch synthase/alpha-amylase